MYIVVVFEYWEGDNPIPHLTHWVALPDEADLVYDAIYDCYPEMCKIVTEWTGTPSQVIL